MSIKETDAVFIAGDDGRFVYEDITIERNGASSYKVQIGSGDDIITCEVPHVYSLLTFLTTLTHKNPLFTSLADHSPANMIKC